MQCTNRTYFNNSRKTSSMISESRSLTSHREEHSTSSAFLNQITSSPNVIVYWYDACTTGGPGWVSAEEAEECVEEHAPPLMRSIGFLIGETPDYIIITSHIGPNETGSITHIPRGMIFRMNDLNIGETRK